MSKFLAKISEMNTFRYLIYLIIIGLIFIILLVTYEIVISDKYNSRNSEDESLKQVTTNNISNNDSVLANDKDNTLKDSSEIKNKTNNNNSKSNKNSSFESLFYNDKEDADFKKQEEIKKQNELKRKKALEKKNRKPKFATPDFIKNKGNEEIVEKKAVVIRDTVPYNRNKNETDNIIQIKSKSAKKCIRRSRLKFKGLTGVIDYQISISKDGKITDIKVLSSKWNSNKHGKKTEECIKKTMKYWKFPIVRNNKDYIIKSKFVF